MPKPTYRGHVKGGAVVLDDALDLPDGVEVMISPVDAPQGSPAAILAAMHAPPHVTPEAAEELRQSIEAGKRPISYRNPMKPKRRR
ncbi:MAG: hypothetical protein HZA54_09755 [Planctomycetes bacterium]|nr:hypothetical protein [Planctomycetota bacterium]